MRPSQPVRSTLPVAGNSAVFQPVQPDLVGELATVLAAVVEFYGDADCKFGFGERVLLERVWNVLTRARREGWRP